MIQDTFAGRCLLFAITSSLCISLILSSNVYHTRVRDGRHYSGGRSNHHIHRLSLRSPSIVTLNDDTCRPCIFWHYGSRYGTAVDMNGDNPRQTRSDRSKAWFNEL